MFEAGMSPRWCNGPILGYPYKATDSLPLQRVPPVLVTLGIYDP